MNEFYMIHCYQRRKRKKSCLVEGDVTGVSWTCRGRHGEVGIVEFGLNMVVRFYGGSWSVLDITDPSDVAQLPTKSLHPKAAEGLETFKFQIYW